MKRRDGHPLWVPVSSLHFWGRNMGPVPGPVFHGPERVSEAGERTEVTPKLKPYPMPATVSPRDIACSHTSFVLRHTSTLNPNPKLQRHLDPAGFLAASFWREVGNSATMQVRIICSVCLSTFLAPVLAWPSVNAQPPDGAAHSRRRPAF